MVVEIKEVKLSKFKKCVVSETTMNEILFKPSYLAIKP